MHQPLNPVLMLTRNSLALSRRAIASVLAQDIKPAAKLLVVENDSSDGTMAYLQALQECEAKLEVVGFTPQLGVSAGWNWGLRQWFEFSGADHVLVLNNDVELPKWFYSTLLGRLTPEVGFVTGVATDDRASAKATECPTLPPLAACPDFSAYLITRAVWEAVGPFDERMKFYAQDIDYHLRAHRMGIGLWNAGLPYYHQRSSTLNNASEQERAKIQYQAEQDRGVFRSLYGALPGDPGYDSMFGR